MSTVESRKNTVARLLDVWNRNPHLRLSQLLSNVYDGLCNNPNTYFLLDSEFVTKVEDFYGKRSNVVR